MGRFKALGLQHLKTARHLRYETERLASLGEAIREYGYERLVNEIFKQSKSGLETVRNYAVLDLGFDIKNQEGTTSRAGMVLRQAHERSSGAYSLIDNERALKIEKLLRRYGVTSAGAHRNKWPYEWLNIQGTKDGAVMTTEEVMKLQPEPALRVPLKVWGTSVSGTIDPAFDNPWIWSHELAESLRRGKHAGRVSCK